MIGVFLCRSSRPEVFCKKDVLRNFAKFTRNYLYQRLFKKETLAQAFSYEFCEISKNTFFIEHHWWLLLFMWPSIGNLNIFNTLNLKQVFWKTKTFLKKLKYRYLVQNPTTDSTTLKANESATSYKTALSKPNVKTNWMGSINGPIAKNGLLPLTTSFFENLIWV